MKNKKFLILMNVVLLIFGGPVALILGSIASMILYKLADSPSEGANFSGHSTSFDHSGRDSGLDVDNSFDDGSFTHSSISDDTFTNDSTIKINPATGLPMMGNGIGGVDVGGNPYGTDLHDSFGTSFDDSFSSSFDDSFSSSFDDSFSSSFDDGFNSGGINND